MLLIFYRECLLWKPFCVYYTRFHKWKENTGAFLPEYVFHFAMGSIVYSSDGWGAMPIGLSTMPIEAVHGASDWHRAYAVSVIVLCPFIEAVQDEVGTPGTGLFSKIAYCDGSVPAFST
jgi:hypothetical protein